MERQNCFFPTAKAEIFALLVDFVVPNQLFFTFFAFFADLGLTFFFGRLKVQRTF